MGACRKLAIALAVATMPALAFAGTAGKNVGAVTGGQRLEAGKIIDERCLSCHNKAVIEKAQAQKRDMEKITKEMEAKGAVLTDREREVLQHFWKGKAFKSK